MPKIAYRDIRFNEKTLATIRKANEILEEYSQQGYVLTLRQLYYQFVARDLIPNKQKEYNNLGAIISNARLAGLIDWHYLIDRTRNLQTLQHFDDGKDALKKLASWYHLDFWQNQTYRPEVWIEKDALIGVIEDTCQEFDIPYFSCRGYTSQSEMWRAARRLQHYVEAGQTPYIFHFGDHDPSGKDMSRDILDRLRLFMGTAIEFERVALNMDQVEQYDPPPNPAKITDSRATAYIAEFGEESWELDALEPKVINDLIREGIAKIRDEDIWNEDAARKLKVKTKLERLAKNWRENRK